MFEDDHVCRCVGKKKKSCLKKCASREKIISKKKAEIWSNLLWSSVVYGELEKINISWSTLSKYVKIIGCHIERCQNNNSGMLLIVATMHSVFPALNASFYRPVVRRVALLVFIVCFLFVHEGAQTSATHLSRSVRTRSFTYMECQRHKHLTGCKQSAEFSSRYRHLLAVLTGSRRV